MNLQQQEETVVSKSTQKPVEIMLRGVEKEYTTPGGYFSALRGISLDVQASEFVAVVGKSGSGKSTLSKCLGGY